MPIHRRTWADCAEVSHAHGVFELTHFRSWKKFVWMAVTTVCLVAMSYNAAKLIVDFRSEPIVTYVKNFDKHNTFPTIMLCPTHFKYNTTKFDMNIDLTRDKDRTTFSRIPSPWLQAENYWTSFESGSYLKGAISQASLSKRLDKEVLFTEEKWARIGRHVWETVIGNQSYAELELSYLADFDKLIVEHIESPIINKRKRITILGGCFVFEIESKIRRTFAKTSKISCSLRRNRWEITEDERAKFGFFITNTDFLYLGEPSFLPKNTALNIPQHSVRLDAKATDPGAVYSISEMRYFKHIIKECTITAYVTSIEFSRLNLRRRPCRNWSSHDRSICMVDCFNDEFCSKMKKPCLIFHPNQTREEQYKKLCSWVEGPIFYLQGTTDHCLIQDSILNGGPYDLYCEERCPIQCKEEIYYFSHQILEEIVYEPGNKPPHSRDLWANVTLRFQDSLRRLKIEEHNALNAYEFAAETGGAVAVWIGISGLAIAQTITFIVEMSFTRK